MLGIFGIPAVNACASHPAGLVTCLRDLIDRRFDLPGDVLPADPIPSPTAAGQGGPLLPARPEPAEQVALVTVEPANATTTPAREEVAAGPSPATPSPNPTVAPPVALAPTIDAIELDGERSFVSGTGPAGALMQLFADDELVGEGEVEAGRWRIETGPLLTAPKRELRILALDPETLRPLGDAAITVEVELPPDAEPFEEPEEVEIDAAPAPSPSAPPPGPAVPTRPRSDVPSGSGTKLSVLRGDSLWTISRRHYGSGRHFRVIFDANRDQIRRPSRIYPGQVFVLPASVN